MDRNDRYGPALPPGMVVAGASSTSEGKSLRSKNVIGPTLPPGMQKSSDSDDLSDEGPLTVKMDPEMSPEYPMKDGQEEIDDDDDDETVGPMPSEMSEGVSVGDEFEKRAKRMKDQLTTVKAEAEEGPSKREDWMTELPPDMSKNFGLQNRQFAKGAGGPDDKDRSSWTEIQGVKKEKDLKGKKRKRDDVVSVRDQQLQQQVDEYNKSKRPDSLIDMHNKKQKKKKKKEKKKEKKEKKKRKEKGEKEEKEGRRPFDRDTDLQANRFDDAQRKKIIQKSALLNTKFSKGATTSHFL